MTNIQARQLAELIVAYWTPESIDEEYRKSGLMREKWNRQQSGTTYGALVIEKAMQKGEKP